MNISETKLLSRTSKVKLYNTLIVTVLIYASEAWILTDSDERMLVMFKNKVLRTIYGPVCVDGKWIIFYNYVILCTQSTEYLQFVSVNSLKNKANVRRYSPN